ncbi:MAG TPA: hypothetical protein DHT43_04015 [Deltaproteobacteria bacterium]|nr:hypothetical protein [Deltaproteobacteria bacterium]
MAWKNQLQLKEKYTDPEFQKTFAEIFTLHWFLERCLVSSEYKIPNAFGDAISLTSTGKEWVPRIEAAVRDISLPEIKLVLFIKFFHHELFVDVNTTNPEAIRKVLDAEIVGGRIRYPWVYGRLLYDRFFDMFPIQTKELSYEETMKLLQNTPQGVFQIRDVLVGPFGVLNSSCHRFLPPTRTVSLWHCSDPSCDAIHPVLLSTGESKVLEAITLISDQSEKADGPPSEWFGFFRDFAGKSDYYDDMQLGQFPWLLVNAFSKTEMQNILRRLIDQHSKEIRQRFPKTKRFNHILSGSAEKISEGMTKPQCFQLMLLMPDEVIASSVESLIEEGIINVPPTETRTPGVTYGPGSWLAISCECSRFGVRSVARKKDIALARLKHLIRVLYKEERESAQLQWKLRRINGESIYEKLDRYVHTEDLKRIVSDLVLASSDHLQRAFQILRYGWFVLPSFPEEEERLVEKILWKLGFDIGLYPPHQRLFWERLEKLLETARTYTTYDEHDRELIRSAGVNFFVSLEGILDYSLSFTTWALLSDHYGVTKFKCNFDDARRFMVSRLNGLQLGSNEPLEFNAEGKNTLYPLVQGFTVLAELCSELIEGRNGDLRRPENEFPGYYGKTEVELFPLLHKALILDLRKGDCDRIIGLLREITATFEKFQVCNIRNRIEHRRPDFPSQEEIERACGAVTDTVNKMEAAGVCPLIYLYSGRTVDQYGRNIVMFKDYRGRQIIVNRPSQYSLCRLPSLHWPQIIVPWVHIGDSVELLRFQFEEISDYVKMWRGYPKRRPRVPSKELKEKLDSEQKQLEE